MIYGSIEGIRNTVLNRLEKLYEYKVDKTMLISQEILDEMCSISKECDREISVGINRRGEITSVSMGDSTTVELPEILEREKKLSGIRIVHTHPNGNPKLSALDLSALLKLKLDCIAAVGVGEEGKFTGCTLGFCSIFDDIFCDEQIGPLDLIDTLKFDVLDKIIFSEELIKNAQFKEEQGERAILVSVDDEESLDELEELAKACEVQTVYKVFQNKMVIDSAFYIGKGKVQEISYLRQIYKANVVIFDDELTAAQVKNLENEIGCKIIDRTTLILEIFARRAKTKEAKIQVELAQLKYRLARLYGLGTVLSRTGGGIGTRGPGEKKLEVDKRHIRERVYDLQKELIKIKKVRETQREKRVKDNIPKVSLVGYTNAGKSTLRNILCGIYAPAKSSNKENVFEADMLFATLDVTTRAIMLPDNRTVTLSDTVGFVRKLPHDLVESFKSTLEEVVYSDLLLHVVDASGNNPLSQIYTVEEVLSQLGAKEKPTLIILNKIDKASKDIIEDIKQQINLDYIEISAKNGVNLDKLIEKISEMLPNKLIKAEFLIPYTDQQLVAYIHRNSNVECEEYEENGTRISASVNEEVYNKCKPYVI